MKKNLSLIIIFYLSLITLSYGAASSGGNGAVSSSSNYDKGAYLIKKAKKLEKKGKTEKAKKRYEKALSYLIKSNEKKPNQPDTLNYLGFALRKLGELYIQTNRINLAKERLDVLKNCKCEEYEELKELIENI